MVCRQRSVGRAAFERPRTREPPCLLLSLVRLVVVVVLGDVVEILLLRERRRARIDLRDNKGGEERGGDVEGRADALLLDLLLLPREQRLSIVEAPEEALQDRGRVVLMRVPQDGGALEARSDQIRARISLRSELASDSDSDLVSDSDQSSHQSQATLRYSLIAPDPT